MARAVAHVFVADLAQPSLRPEDARHLARVLRLRPGETVSASDGQGGVRPCRWGPPGQLVPTAEPTFEPGLPPPITVAFALTKGQAPEVAVQKLTETGVDRIIVVDSARCVARWDADAQPRQLARLREVARQAAMQSRRNFLPSVEGVLPFASVASLPGAALAAPGGAPPRLCSPTLLIGPEGGWSEEELAAVPERVGLGPHVLRAGTAAVVAGALLSALRSGLVGPAVAGLAPGGVGTAPALAPGP